MFDPSTDTDSFVAELYMGVVYMTMHNRGSFSGRRILRFAITDVLSKFNAGLILSFLRANFLLGCLIFPLHKTCTGCTRVFNTDVFTERKRIASKTGRRSYEKI